MHSKMSRFAEKVGDELSLSRRGFFSYLTKTAAVAAGAVGTLLTLSPRAHADSQKCWCTWNGAASCVLRANCLLSGGRCVASC
jgi:hypothetical protein